MLDLILSADMWFENLMLTIRTPFFLDIFNAITILGNVVFVIVVTILICAFLLFSKRFKEYSLRLALVVIGAGITGYILKEIVGRARPDGLISTAVENSPSFPSMHAILAVALYGFLAYFLSKLYPKYTALITTLASLLILAIGFSRLYLGVHFPSDVVVGFIIGGLWIFNGIRIATFLKKNAIVQ